MKALLRTGLLTATALASAHADAKPVDRCIPMLEARPSVDAVTGRPHCPLAISWTQRDGAAMPRASRAEPPASQAREARLDDERDALPESIEPEARVLHV